MPSIQKFIYLTCVDTCNQFCHVMQEGAVLNLDDDLDSDLDTNRC